MISLLCPSRERPDLARKMAESALSTCSAPTNIEILFYVDHDDPKQDDYFRVFHDLVFMKRVLILSETDSIAVKSVGEAWNKLAYYSIGDYLYMMNDDIVFQTTNWDLTLVSEHQRVFFDNIGVIFADDGINQGRHCAFPLVSRLWYEILGYFTPECFEFMAHDTYIFDIAKRVDRVHYCPDVFVQHKHWTITKVKDATTKRHRDDTNNTRIPKDLRTFEETAYLREKDAAKLLSYIKGLKN